MMTPKLIKRTCILTPKSQQLLTQAIEQLNLSARAYDRILKVARTIADLEDEQQIQPQNIAEAIHLRSLDRKI